MSTSRGHFDCFARRLSAFALLAALSCTPSAGNPTSSGASQPTIASPRASSSNASGPDNPHPATTPEQAFRDLAQRFVAGYLQREPVASTEAGEHAYDGAFPDLSVEGEAEAKQFYAGVLSELERIAPEGLTPELRVDRAILENQLRYALFALEELREPETSALSYMRLIRNGVEPLVMRHVGTPEQRVVALVSRLESVARIVAIARKRLGHPSRVDTEAAIAEAQGLALFCRAEVTKAFLKQQNDTLVLRLSRAGEAAANALADFQAFLERELLPRSDGSYRLGRERFQKKLRYFLDDDIDLDALEKGASHLLADTQSEMAETAKELWPTIFRGRKLMPSTTPDEKKALVREVLYALAWDAPTDQTLLADAKDLVAKATAFVREQNLVGLPSEPAQVVLAPSSRRGFSIAFCDSTGPLEDKPDAQLVISPAPSEWDDGRRLSYYREYNRSMLADLLVHEAMPGHFLQIATSRRERSPIRSVFASGAFLEGWAVYSEWLMAAHGFGGPRVRIQRQKMVLRLAANALLDCGVHAGKMSEADALALLMGEAFQEEGEAVGKWKRAELTSAQLSTYMYGFTEMMKLRRAAEARAGFSERAFHDAILAEGPVSPRHLRVLLRL